MNTFDKKAHWEKIYSTKALEEFSWYQKTPSSAIRFLAAGGHSKNARILDVGGGDGFFADHLLDQGYTDVSVLDLSSVALSRAQQRHGARASKINWIVSDILAFSSDKVFDFWFDRAVFHFLTTADGTKAYVKKAAHLLSPKGEMVLGTFSPNGPKKCSGIPVKQYDEQEIERIFSPYFKVLGSEREIHTTPFHTQQEFLFTRFCLNP